MLYCLDPSFMCSTIFLWPFSMVYFYVRLSGITSNSDVPCPFFCCCFFKLGGPLSLPWGLYVLICQVRMGAYWCFRYMFTQRQNWCIEKHANLSKPSDLSQRTPEKPCLNDVSDVGTWRRAALIASVFLVVLTLIPLWDELAEELGVGLVTSFWDTECLLIELGRDVAQFCIKISIRSAVKEHAIPIREYAMRLVQVGFARTVSHNSKASCEYAAATICDFEYDVWTNFVTINCQGLRPWSTRLASSVRVRSTPVRWIAVN